jgi:toxin YoeB
MKPIELDSLALQDLEWWISTDKKTALRIVKLLREVQRTPFTGTGKPEPLRHELQGLWSRRVTQEHRLVYEVRDESIRVLACRYHYD